MANEKMIQLNVDAAKAKLQEASQKAYSATSEKVQEATETIRERTSEQRERFMSRLVDKGISLTQKQLGYLKKMKTKASASKKKK